MFRPPTGQDAGPTLDEIQKYSSESFNIKVLELNFFRKQNELLCKWITFRRIFSALFSYTSEQNANQMELFQTFLTIDPTLQKYIHVSGSPH